MVITFFFGNIYSDNKIGHGTSPRGGRTQIFVLTGGTSFVTFNRGSPPPTPSFLFKYIVLTYVLFKKRKWLMTYELPYIVRAQLLDLLSSVDNTWSLCKPCSSHRTTFMVKTHNPYKPHETNKDNLSIGFKPTCKSTDHSPIQSHNLVCYSS